MTAVSLKIHLETSFSLSINFIATEQFLHGCQFYVLSCILWSSAVDFYPSAQFI
jgi:hypothetical protein